MLTYGVVVWIKQVKTRLFRVERQKQLNLRDEDTAELKLDYLGLKGFTL